MFPESLLQSLVKHKVNHCFSDTSIGGSNPAVKATQTFSVVDTHGTLKATGAPLVSAPKGRKEGKILLRIVNVAGYAFSILKMGI